MEMLKSIAQRIEIDQWLEKLGVSPIVGFHIDNLRYQCACHVFETNQPTWWDVLMFDNDPTKAILMAHMGVKGETATLSVPYGDAQEAPVYLGTMCVSMMLWSNACSVIERDTDLRKMQQLYHFARDMIYAQVGEVNDDVKPCVEWRIENLPLTEAHESIAFKILD